MTVLAMAMQSGQGHKLVARRDPATVSRLSQHVGAVATPLPVQVGVRTTYHITWIELQCRAMRGLIVLDV
jgi:hypothetical protein